MIITLLLVKKSDPDFGLWKLDAISDTKKSVFSDWDSFSFLIVFSFLSLSGPRSFRLITMRKYWQNKPKINRKTTLEYLDTNKLEMLNVKSEQITLPLWKEIFRVFNYEQKMIWFLFVFKQSLRWLHCLPLRLQSHVEFAGCQIFIFNLYFSVDLSILIWLQIIISSWLGCQNEPATGLVHCTFYSESVPTVANICGSIFIIDAWHWAIYFVSDWLLKLFLATLSCRNCDITTQY